MYDTLPKKKSELIESGIFKLDSNNSQGSHWVCYYCWNCLDTFGLSPPDEVGKYIKNLPSGQNVRFCSSYLLQQLWNTW